MEGFNFRIVAALLLITSCGSEGAEPASPARPAPLVSVAEATVLPKAGGGESAGTVRLRSEVALGFTSPGQIASVSVDDGDRVRRGQTLAELSQDTVAAALAEAKAEASRAARELARTQELFTDGWVTRARLDDAQAAASAARAQADAAEFAVRTARITAPSDGVILQRLAEPGQVVEAGTPVLMLGRGDQGFVIRVPLTDRQAAMIDVGAAVDVHIDALEAGPLRARLTELAGRADPETGTFHAEFTLPATDGLRSGQIGTVDLPVGGDRNALYVPTASLMNARAGEAVLWVYDEDTGTVSQRTVTVNGIANDGAEIGGGLAPGERVVTANADGLRDGEKVRVP